MRITIERLGQQWWRAASDIPYCVATGKGTSKADAVLDLLEAFPTSLGIEIVERIAEPIEGRPLVAEACTDLGDLSLRRGYQPVTAETGEINSPEVCP